MPVLRVQMLNPTQNEFQLTCSTLKLLGPQDPIQTDPISLNVISCRWFE